MSMESIKMIIKAIAKPLTFVCNQSFLTGIFPHGMKIARGVTISKSGQKNKFSNYRPISIYPNFQKIKKNFLK